MFKKSSISSCIVSVFAMVLLQGCECSNSSSNYYSSPKPYYNPSTPSYQNSNTLTQEQLQQLLKQLESSQSVRQPVQRQRVQRSSDWDRGYSYGWDDGYEDAVNGNGAWASYDDSGKGGDFLDGYESGYIDGYENGKNDRDEDDEEIEDL